jgi:hypothetical protein
VENIVKGGGMIGNELNPYIVYDRIISRDDDGVGYDE